MTLKEKRLLSKAKYNAYILKSNYQIPYVLYMAFVKLDENSSETYVKYLGYMVAKYSRLKGFYNFNSDDSIKAIEECKKDLENFKE